MMASHQSSFYDDEGKKLVQALGGYGPRPTMYQNLNVIYEHPTTKGKIYCGNQTAASDMSILQANGITHVVNCTNGYGEIKNFHEGKLQYYRFPISDFRTRISMTDDATVHAFVDPLFAFIDSAINNGSNVLVHCLAGAHRAGTTSTSCIIYYEKMDVNSAIATAKSRRPIIDPICDFPIFLKRLHDAKIKNATNSRANN